MKHLILLLVGLSSLSACTHSLHVHHQGDFSPTYASYSKGDWITAETEQFVIMNFVTQTDYVNEAFRKLEAQCKGGLVQGVQTEFATSHGFFSWTNRLRMQGLCLKRS